MPHFVLHRIMHQSMEYSSKVVAIGFQKESAQAIHKSWYETDMKNIRIDKLSLLVAPTVALQSGSRRVKNIQVITCKEKARD